MRISRFAVALGAAVAVMLGGAGAASAAAPVAGVHASHRHEGRGADSGDRYQGADSGYYNHGRQRDDDRSDRDRSDRDQSDSHRSDSHRHHER